MINFVSLLGWTPNDGAQQILTMNDLISQVLTTNRYVERWL